MPKLLLLVVLVGALPACWAEESPPGVTPCSCNNNGTCELDKEDCACCPSECPCCRAVLAAGTDLPDADNTIGESDGTFAALGPTSTLTLTVGSQITLPASGLTSSGDFVLIGQVTSDSTLTVAGTCADGAPSGDGYQVEVSVDGSDWALVGFWTKTRAPTVAGQGQAFSLGCATAKPNQVRHVRLTPLGSNPSAQLDAIVVMPDSCATP